MKSEIQEEIGELTKSHQITCQKFDNLDRKIDNLEERMSQQLANKEEQIMTTVKKQIEILDTKFQEDREDDRSSFNKQIELLKEKTSQEQELNIHQYNTTNEQLKEQERKFEKYQHRIHVVEDQVEELRHTTTKVQQSSQPSHITVTCTGSYFNKDIVKFNGKFTNPQEFLGKLRRLYERNKIRYEAENSKYKSIDCLHEVIDSSLEHSAAQWWQLNKEKVESWDQFEDIFKEKYWNKQIQRHLKQKIELEKYKPGGRLNRVEYFLERVLTLNSMTPPLSEEEIVNILTTHYDDVIQTAQRVQHLYLIKDFEALLQREDMLDIQRNIQTRNRPRGETKNNPNFQGTQPFQERDHFKAYVPNHRNEPTDREDHRYKNFLNKRSTHQSSYTEESRNREEPMSLKTPRPSRPNLCQENTGGAAASVDVKIQSSSCCTSACRRSPRWHRCP